MNKSTLQTYRNKRDFQRTAEPSGKREVKPSARARFVIQKHAARRLHYDLRLEMDGVFKSWAVTKGPSLDPSDKRLAVEVEDHPLDYGDFEGTIPAGEYGGGTVQLWDRGYWSVDGGADPMQALARGELKFQLEGKRLRGGFVLVRMRNDRNGGKRTNWLLIKHRDRYAQPGKGDAVLADDKSVASGRAMQAIAAGKGRAPAPFMLANGSTARAKKLATLPRYIEPQLCKLVDTPPTGDGWVHEVKFDGYRVQLRVDGGSVRMSSRNGLDWTHRFGAIAGEAARLPDCIIDGEVVALDHRKVPSFAALQAALSEGNSESLVLFAFDLLVEGREDCRPLPLLERKQRLQQLLSDAGSLDHIRYVEHFESKADTVLRSACKMELEGIVSKRVDAPYASGRGDAWTKSKCRTGHEVVLGGWTTESGTVRSLLAGVNRDGHLVYVGRIGTGFGRDTAARILPKLKRFTRQQSPFGGDNAPKAESNVRWLKPELVAEIEFAGWTGAGMIRQAAFKGLREDKAAANVVAETPVQVAQSTDTAVEKLADEAAERAPSRSKPADGARRRRSGIEASTATAGGGSVMGVVLSKPDKQLWPDAGDGTPVTKHDLAVYFEQVGHWMLPHLRGRPCSLVRAPDGIGGQQFFQRHAMPGMSNLFTLVKVKGDKAPYVQIDRAEALIAAAQIGALEMHPWNCAPDRTDVAGRLVFDLDPAPDVEFGKVIEGALELRRRLNDVGLSSLCKTTGGKGLHVVVPLDVAAGKGVEWPTAKQFAHLICAQMAADSPRQYLDRMAKAERAGRIFLDYLRNDRTATAVSPLSPRARSGAPVSMPLNWQDVKPGLAPLQFTVRTAPDRLQQSQAWNDYDANAGSLLAAIKQVAAAPTVSISRAADSRRSQRSTRSKRSKAARRKRA